jgi:hypothetical protein
MSVKWSTNFWREKSSMLSLEMKFQTTNKDMSSSNRRMKRRKRDYTNSRLKTITAKRCQASLINQMFKYKTLPLLKLSRLRLPLQTMETKQTSLSYLTRSLYLKLI